MQISAHCLRAAFAMTEKQRGKTVKATDLPQSGSLSFALEDVPASVLEYPSMASDMEKSLLYSLAKDYFIGEGNIIDAGIFLGGSSNALAKGLKDNGRWRSAAKFVGKPIHSYDIGIWVRSMDKYLRRPRVKRAIGKARPKVGQSFVPILKDLLADDLDLIDLRIGDIVELAVGDGPIEIAFYDCLKTPEREWAAFSAFAPHYIPGRTIIIHQDWFYEGAPDHKIRQMHYADHFDFLCQVRDSAVFRYRGDLEPTATKSDAVAGLSTEHRLEMLSEAEKLAADSFSALRVRLSAIGHCLERGEFARAEHQLDTTEDQFHADLTADREGGIHRFSKLISEMRAQIDEAIDGPAS